MHMQRTVSLRKRKGGLFRQCLSVVLSVALLVTMSGFMPGSIQGAKAADALSSITEQPILLVSGDGIISNGDYTEDNVSNERSYTLEELQELEEIEQLYSAINTTPTRSIYLGKGITLEKLLQVSGVSTAEYGEYNVDIVSGDGSNYTIRFDPSYEGQSATRGKPLKTPAFSVVRYYYPNIAELIADVDGDGNFVYDNDEEASIGAELAPAMLAWERGGDRGKPDIIPTETEQLLSDEKPLLLMVGQQNVYEQNNPLFNKVVQKVLFGAGLTATSITIDEKEYTRGEILLMERADRAYTYSTQGGEKTDYVRGVPLAVLLAGHEDGEIISFTAADGYDMSSASITVAEAIADNYILAYEKGTGISDLAGIFDTAKGNDSIKGYFSLYGDSIKPSKLIDSITVSPAGYVDYTNSPYKHINNGGKPGSAPYNIDAITGATLTVEGPGVEATTPILMGDLEKTDNNNLYRGNYTDVRGGDPVTFSYEGVRVSAIIDGLVNDTVEKVDNNVRIVFKNRWRQDVGSISYSELLSSETPVILAYGTGTVDEETVAPFVFDKALGINTSLGNDDGCLKLVYDKDELTNLSDNPKFVSVAYVYVERGGERPGFKHSEALDEAYRNVVNMEHLIAFTGSALGREVNYTVKELEEMVEYEGGLPKAGGLGHRAEYGLSNTTYWYVNEYEGIKLWDLLTARLGLDAEQYRNDEETLVSLASWDNYQTTAKFSMAQLADPDRFYFYEKSPLDIGTDRPTKENLADEEYHPDNQIGAWVADSNGYPIKKGYPVMLAYGVNGYPYVRDSRLPGFAGGLGNDGGPIRIIFGKTDGMNRDNPSALENYAYFYNNGSNQLQRAQEIYVGDGVRYSTHLENPDYISMKDAHGLTVEIKQGGTASTHDFTLGELENVLYGVSKSDREKQGRQEKAYYAHKVYQESLLDDLFEGVNLWYLLSEEIGMQGVLGTVKLYSGADENSSLDMSLTDLQITGYNSQRGTEGLGMMVAFAKNGYPMVLDKNADGYLNKDTVTGKDIKNSDGPLMLVKPQTAAEKAAGTPGATVKNLTKIVVDLEPDVYAHTGDYASYGENQVAFTGAVKNEGVTLKVSDIEKLQKFMVTDTYTVNGTAKTYRGVELNNLLISSSVGASALLNKVTITNADGKTKEVTVSDMKTAGKPIILAYGIGKAGADPAGKPLVPDEESAGYDADYVNSGGPLRLIIDGAGAEDCIENVKSIDVTASELTGWTHSTGYYEAYKDYPLELSGTNLSKSMTMTVEQVESLSDTYKVLDTYRLSNELYFEGIDLLKLFRDYIGFSGGLQTSSITVYASDNYAISFTATDLLNGVNGKPIILAYGQGVSPDRGLPLVGGGDQTDIQPGFDPVIGNAFGPLRLIVNDNSGWCNKWVNKIVVGSAGTVDPPAAADFKLTNGEQITEYNIKNIKSITEGAGGKATASYIYTSKEGLETDHVKGVYLTDLLTAAGISGDQATVTLNMTDGFESKQESYRDIPLAELNSKAYFLAYDAGPSADNMGAIADVDKNDVKATVRIYRNYDDGSTWLNRITNVAGITITGAEESPVFKVYPGTGENGQLPMASIRDIVTDADGGMWVGTNSGGAWYKPVDSGEFTINTVSSEGYVLASDVIQAIAVDSDGGVWFSQSKTYNPVQAHLNRGAAYLKDGVITYYNSEVPGTIPNDYVQAVQIDDNGNVWFGSFGGLTKYEPGNGTWTTWDQNYTDGNGNSFPALSVDNIHLDGKGGLWIGFYPNGAGTEADPFVGGFAHMDAGGNITPYEFTAEYDSALGSSLLAQVWVRDIAVDKNGGAWVVASGSYSDLANVGGTVWYVDKDGMATKFTGKDLLGAGKLTGNSEIRMVSIDADGGMWLGTSEDGLFHIARPEVKAPLQVTAQYNSANGAWPDSFLYDNIYVLNIIDDYMYLGSNGGVVVAAMKDIAADDEPEPQVIESFTISGVGSADILYYVGGSHEKTFKGLADSAGKVKTDYPYNGETHYVLGASLQDLLSDAGAGEKIKVTIKTSDGYTKDSYENISYADIVAKDYFVAYDVGEGTETLSKIADTDKSGVTASFRIYRNLDDGTAEKKDNRIKGVIGIVVSPAGGGGTTPEEYALTIDGPGVNTTIQYTLEQLKSAAAPYAVTKSYKSLNSYGTIADDSFRGIYLVDLLEKLAGLKSSAKSVTATAADGYYRSFNLDDKALGIYWSDIQGNKIMLAWERNGSPCPLQLAIGQTDPEHVNKPMWVSDIKTITVSATTTTPGGGTPGSYEGQKKDEGANVGATLVPSVKVDGEISSAGVNLEEIKQALKELEEQAGDGAKSALEINAVSSAGAGQIKETGVTLPADVVQALAQAEVPVLIRTDLGVMLLSAEVISQMAAGEPQDIVLIITATEEDDLDMNDESADKIGGRPVYNIRLLKGGQEITSLNGKQIKITIPYVPASSENTENLIVYYIDDSGNGIPVVSSRFDEEAGGMVFETVHLSHYAVGYNAVTFIDIENHWARDNIEYLAVRGILSGKGNNLFDPEGKVTRAEFVTMLANLAGADVSKTSSAGFADVEKGAWYEGYINWAVASKIVSGYGDKLFGPADPITREQMAVMLDKYLNTRNADQQIKEAAAFTDQDKISSWALDSVSKVQQYGIISGRTDGSFAPQDNTSRAEAATVIKASLLLQ